MTTGKTIALTRQTFVNNVISLLFNMLSRLVITFLPRSKCFLISWLQSPSAVILEAKKIKSVTVSTVSPPICHEVMGLDVMILVFWTLSFKPAFSLSSFTFIRRFFSSYSLWAIRVVSPAYLRLLIFLHSGTPWLVNNLYMCIHKLLGKARRNKKKRGWELDLLVLLNLSPFTWGINFILFCEYTFLIVW